MLSDLEAIKAIDRLAFAWSRNPDVIALRPWIAAHCGLNPPCRGTIGPGPGYCRRAGPLAHQGCGPHCYPVDKAAARAVVADKRIAELKAALADAKNTAKRDT
jgi:hypothetical protein